MRLSIITQYFWPESGAPPGRLFELAVRLRRLGQEVTILTALPNYPRGRIYDGDRGRLCMIERHEGLRILRAPICPTQSARGQPTSCVRYADGGERGYACRGR